MPKFQPWLFLQLSRVTLGSHNFPEPQFLICSFSSCRVGQRIFEGSSRFKVQWFCISHGQSFQPCPMVSEFSRGLTVVLLEYFSFHLLTILSAQIYTGFPRNFAEFLDFPLYLNPYPFPNCQTQNRGRLQLNSHLARATVKDLSKQNPGKFQKDQQRLAFHPDILSGISGPWLEINNPGENSLSLKREFLETLLKQRARLWLIHFVISKKSAEVYTIPTKAHGNLLSDTELSGLAIIHP